MNPCVSRIKPWIASVGLATTVILSAASVVQAQEDDAHKILKAMSDYVTSQKSFEVTYDADIEVVTLDLQKLQFTGSGQVVLSRPDKLRAVRMGGYTDVEYVIDGKTFTVHDRDHKVFAQAEEPGTIDQVLGKLREERSIEAPGADLLLANPYEVLTESVLEGKHIGQGVIDGVECEHLAFRAREVDWQIWIQTGPNPIPRKYVITSRAVTGGPQYTLRIKEWRANPQVAPDIFTFKAPEGTRKIDFGELKDIDEVPAGTVVGENK
jgi:hypothetical protein